MQNLQAGKTMITSIISGNGSFPTNLQHDKSTAMIQCMFHKATTKTSLQVLIHALNVSLSTM
jgi:hypothetical protein